MYHIFIKILSAIPFDTSLGHPAVSPVAQRLNSSASKAARSCGSLSILKERKDFHSYTHIYYLVLGKLYDIILYIFFYISFIIYYIFYYIYEYKNK